MSKFNTVDFSISTYRIILLSFSIKNVNQTKLRSFSQCLKDFNFKLLEISFMSIEVSEF